MLAAKEDHLACLQFIVEHSCDDDLNVCMYVSSMYVCAYENVYVCIPVVERVHCMC